MQPVAIDSDAVPKQGGLAFVDEGRFNVSVADRAPGFLGDTIRFRLFPALWKRRNRCVDHLDLTEQIGA